eukprot:Rhum_TRINITY_DN15747_c0_g1::Rhum_TRINITY_DN15747_c0_g1_i1::g.162005::m.162005
MKETLVRLCAFRCPEDVYRVPQVARPFLHILPLPQYSNVGRPKGGRRLMNLASRFGEAPKPLWYDGMSQAKLYSSVLKYTDTQLTDERLYKPERHIPPNPSQNAEHLLQSSIDTRASQPSFMNLRPDQKYHDESLEGLPHSLQMMMQDLDTVGPALLPNPALALYGERVVKSIITDFLIDMFPRLHSVHLDRLVQSKMTLANAVTTARTAGISRGMGLEPEVQLFLKVRRLGGIIQSANGRLSDAKKELLKGGSTQDLGGPVMAVRRAKARMNKIALSENNDVFLEHRMNLLARHLYTFVAYAAHVKGESFAQAFVVRYFMQDVALQYFSSKPHERTWLQLNSFWKFKDRLIDDKAPALKSASTRDNLPMIIEGMETSSLEVANSVNQMLTSKNPMKELQIILHHDVVARTSFGRRKAQYRTLHEGHRDDTGERYTRVGVYADGHCLAQGDGLDREDAVQAAAQAALNSYYMNPQANFAMPEPSDEATATKEKKKKKKKKNGAKQADSTAT